MRFSNSSSTCFLSIFVIVFTLLCCFMFLSVGSASAEDVSVVSEEFTATTYTTPVSYTPSSILVSLYNDALSDPNGNGYINQGRTLGCSLSGSTHNLYIRDTFVTPPGFDYCGSNYYDGTSLTSSSGAPSSSVGYVYLDSYVYTDHVVTSDVVSNVLTDYGNLPFTIVRYEDEDEYGYLGYAYVFFDPEDIRPFSVSTPVPSGNITYSVDVTQDSDTGLYTLGISKSDSTTSYYFGLTRQVVDLEGTATSAQIIHSETDITDSSYSLSGLDCNAVNNSYYRYTLGLYDTSFDSLIGQVSWGSLFGSPIPPTPPEFPTDFDFVVSADVPSQSYNVDLYRNDNVLHLAIKGKIFGWMPIYTYYEDRPTFDLISDTHLTGLPAFWMGLGVDYQAQIFGEGSGLTGDSWIYTWNQNNYDFTTGVPVVTPTPYREPPVNFTPIVTPTSPGGSSPSNPGDGSATPTFTPRVPSIRDPIDDNETNISIPGIGDDRDYFSFKDFLDALKSACLPASLLEFFDVETPEEYKNRTSVSPDSLFYGFQHDGFDLIESVLYIPCGVLFSLVGLVAYFPETLNALFAEFVGYLTSSLTSFNEFITIPSMILQKVVTLIPTPVMNIALLLFAVDLFFLFFRLVVPGIISGSKALGSLWNDRKGDK